MTSRSPSRRARAAALLTIALLLAPGSFALLPQRGSLPDFDAGGGLRVGTPPGGVPPAVQAAIATLAASGAGDVQVAFNALSGAPRVLSGRRPLSAPQAGPPEEAALRFLEQHRGIWGFSPEDLAGLRLTARYDDRHSGAAHVFYQQRVGGVPVFPVSLGIHVDPLGRVTGVRGDVFPRLVIPPAPRLTPEQAARIAAASVGVEYQPLVAGVEERTVVFAPGPFLAPVRVSRWVYPLLGPPRAAFRMTLEKNGLEWYDVLVDGSTGEVLHRRNLYQCAGALTPSAPPEANPAAPRGLVYVEHPLSTVRGTGDLPRKYPFTIDPAGQPRGFANAPLSGADTQALVPHGSDPADALLAQTLLPLPSAGAPLRSNGLPLSSAPQSPQGWFTLQNGRYISSGNNVDAKEDHGGDNEATPGVHADAGPAGDFGTAVFLYDNHYGQNGPYPAEAPEQPAGAERLAGALPDLDAAILNLFYLNNWYHDFLYHLGFTEAAGNFQNDNFGRGGAGGDAVFADAQDGSGTSNANFGTPPDGSHPRMQMFLFAGPERDGDFDADVVIHEYTHGLSNRLVGGPNNTDCLGVGLVGESGGMGEGWGDWYAAVITDEPATGEYVTGDGANGIRRFSMDNGPNDFTYGYLCTGPPSNPSLIPCEVHDGGEFWSIVLWEMREAMINRYHNRAFPGLPLPTHLGGGSPAGNIRHAAGRTTDGSGNPAQTDHASIENAAFSALFAVTDGMKLAPCNPTVADMRDAILAADRAAGGEFQDIIWRAFANRGVGAAALSTGGAVPVIVEDFTVPAEVAACEAAGGPLPAPSFSATSTLPNSVTIAISGNGAASYVIYRGTAGAGTPVDPAAFVDVGRTSGTSFNDSGLDGGRTYTYRVRALRNESCVSGSVAVEVVPLGTALPCTAPPSFAGLAGARDAGDCEHVLLDWPAARSNCAGGPDVRYNVYRGTSPSFTPGAGNRIATGIAGLSYSDAPGTTGTLFYYVVRAEDSTSGHGGPAGGNEDANLVRRAAVVTSATLVNQGFVDDVEQGPDNASSAHFSSSGPLVPLIPERGGWFRDDDPAPVEPRSPSRAWHAFDPDNPVLGANDGLAWELRSDTLTVTPSTILTFFHAFQTEGGFDGGVAEYAVVDPTTGQVGSFQDLGPFLYEGGYNGRIEATSTGGVNNNPLFGRAAWTGGSLGTMRRVRAMLGALVPVGQPDARIVIRFLFGNDVANSADPSPTGDYLPGWYIDDVSLDQSCCPMSSAPQDLQAAPAADGEISLTWTAPTGGGIAEYEVYREAAGDAVPQVFDERIAAVPGAQVGYLDQHLVPGVAYYYVVRAIPAAGCPSADSNAARAAATGACTDPPKFQGLRSVSAPNDATCTLDLAWDAAAARCPGASVSYNVHRSTVPGFTPGPANLVASGLGGLMYRDQTVLASATVHYYVVRAQDSLGNQDANLREGSGTPTGPLIGGPPFADDLEPAPAPGYGTFGTRAAGGWTAQPDPTAHSLLQAWVALDDQPGAPPLTEKDDRLMLPPLNLTSTSVLTFFHNFDFARFTADPATAYQSGGVLEISRDGEGWIDLGPYITTGGYNGTVDAAAQNPLKGRAAWVGSSDGDLVPGRVDAMHAVSVELGQAIAQEFGVTQLASARVRFRLGGTFQALLGGIQGTGWGVDDLEVTNVLAAASCSPSAGAIPATLAVSRAGASALRLSWHPSCSAGAQDYGIYRGTIGTWYDHVAVDCTDDDGDLVEEIAVPAGNAYFLVVPRSAAAEGSYGRDSSGVERPAGGGACVTAQVAAGCP
ncbi:MAG: M36 family metallopeptidase [Acidobacteria bacterium]|nr:M36 family metallopeptidase [Acidobacteriota bacterium]